ncbi:MAG TPA: STAS domain-containing protein [Conexibacter sp.]|nr:STAS domain-containing protein [Conexibacter sp.]
MSPLARVVEERREDVSVAAIVGEVDASNTVAIADRLRAAVTNRSEVLVVDLTETAYLDSAGINLLYELANELEHRQQELRLVIAAASPISRMLAIAGVDGAVRTYATRDDAFAGR